MPQMFHVHAKFYDIDENGDEPAMDIPRIVRQFVEGGYQGYLSSEWEGHAFSDLGESDPIELVKKQHALMRRAIEETVARHARLNRTKEPSCPKPSRAIRHRTPGRTGDAARRGRRRPRPRAARSGPRRGRERLQPLHVPAQRVPGRADHSALGEARHRGHPRPLHERRRVHRVRQRHPLPPGSPVARGQAHPARHDDPGHRGRRRRRDRQGRLAHGRHRVGPHRPRGRQGVPRHVLAGRGAGQEGLGALGLVQVRDRLPQAGRRVEDLEVPLLRAGPRSVRGELDQLRREEPGRVRPRPHVLRRRRQARVHAARPTSRCPRRTTRTAPRPCRSSSRFRRCRTTRSPTPSTDLTARTRSPPWPPTTPSSPRRTSVVATTRSPSRCSFPGTAASGCRPSTTSRHPSTASRCRRTSCASS